MFLVYNIIILFCQVLRFYTFLHIRAKNLRFLKLFVKNVLQLHGKKCEFAPNYIWSF